MLGFRRLRLRGGEVGFGGGRGGIKRRGVGDFGRACLGLTRRNPGEDHGSALLRGEDGTEWWGQRVSEQACNGAHGLSGEGAADAWAKAGSETRSVTP